MWFLALFLTFATLIFYKNFIKIDAILKDVSKDLFLENALFSLG